jgi:hypothetical protein
MMKKVLSPLKNSGTKVRKYYLGSWYVIKKIPAPKNPAPKCRKKVRFAKVPDIRQLTAEKKNLPPTDLRFE